MTSRETLTYALARLKEGDTWAGIAGGITGGYLMPEPYRSVVIMAAIAAVLLPQKEKPNA